MKILLVAATFKEIAPLFNYLGIKPHDGIIFYQNFDVNNKKLDILVTGIGMVATSYWMGTVLATSKYDLILNAGIAGSFKKKYPPGTVANVIQDGFPEMGAETPSGFKDIFSMGLLNINEKPFISGQVNNPFKNEYISKNLPTVTAITSNTIHGDEKSIKTLANAYNPGLESMEGAAFMYCCIMNNTRFFQIRAVSNYVEVRDKEKWETKTAINNLFKTLKDFLYAEKID